MPGRRGRQLEDGNYEFTRRFKVFTTSKEERELDVLGADGLPIKGNIHPSQPGAICVERIPEELAHVGGGKSLWIVECIYRTVPLGEQDPQDGETQIFVPEIDWFTSHAQVPLRRVLEKKRVVVFKDDPENDALVEDATKFQAVPTNSAGQPFRNPPLIDEAIQICVITRTTFTYNPSVAFSLTNKLNDSNISIDGFTFDSGVAKLTQWSGRRRITPQLVKVYDERIEIAFNEKGWFLDELDVGTMELDDDDNLKEIRGVNGDLVTDPVLLNGVGVRRTPTDDNLYYMRMRGYYYADMSVLNLPQ